MLEKQIKKAKRRICALTFICSKGDPRPTDGGYRAMAAAFLGRVRVRARLAS